MQDTPIASLGPEKQKDVGKVKIVSKKKRGVRKLYGLNPNGGFGWSVGRLSDINNDGRDEILVGAPRDLTGEAGSTVRPGAVYLFDGKTGGLLDSAVGEFGNQRFGQSVHGVGDGDGDGVGDVLVVSRRNPVQNVAESGGVEVRSGADITHELDEFGGALNDRLGLGSASAGEDGTYIAGSPGVKVAGLKNAGLVTVRTATGDTVWTVQSDQPQKNAQYGAGVAAIGDITGDGIADYAAAAPFQDTVSGGQTRSDAGRVSWLDGADGSLLRVLNGDKEDIRMGRGLAGGVDFNLDGIPDVVVGSPGGSPKGRRGAGSVKIFSGADGNLLRTYSGTRGFETRLFVLGLKQGVVRGFDFEGVQKENVNSVFTLIDSGDLSLAVMDERQRPRVPGGMRIAIGTGHGAQDPRVVILLARSKDVELDNFFAFNPADYSGGVNVAAGDLDDDGVDELIAVTADADNAGRTRVSISRSFLGQNTEGGMIPDGGFVAFGPDDTVGGTPINTDGGTVVVAEIPGTSERGIAVGSATGAPVVRVFTRDGALFSEWFAYGLGSFEGVNVGKVDLDGDGKAEIVTGPRSGPPLVRVFETDGTPFTSRTGAIPTSFLAFDEGFTGGVHVSGADVDYDGEQEILVSPGPGLGDRVLAFEADGTPVIGFNPLVPFGGTNTNGIVVVGTDRFIGR